jgi:Bacterial Ig-like domain
MPAPRVRVRLVVMVVVVAAVATAGASLRVPVRGAAVRPLFDLSSPDGGPFPSDAFTVADASQVTGLRVDLPKPDCAQRSSDCEDIAVLNQLDGFNMQPRLSIPFSGAIDPGSLKDGPVFVVRVRDHHRISINQTVWDPATSTLHAFPDEALDEHTAYAIVVTRSLRDASGAGIDAAEGFQRFRQTTSGRYRQSLIDAVAAAQHAGAREADIAVASVFTTQTFSHIITRMRDAIQRAPAPRLDFAVGPGGTRAVFDAKAIESLTFNADINPGGPLTEQPLTVFGNMRVVPDAVGTLAFGTYRTLDFTTQSEYIAPIATRTGTLTPTGTLDVPFDLWLPSGTPPPRGWPVAIYGTGSFGYKDSAFSHAAVLASHRIAVIAITPIGRGRGPRSTTTVKLTDGTSKVVATPGLGRDTNGDGTIELWEPRRARRPNAVLNTSGPAAQTIPQAWALVRAIQAGVDVDGNGTTDLDASRIYFFGQSLGAMWGMPVFAWEPAIRAAVFTVPVGTLIYNTANTPTDRNGLGELLAARGPSLVNEADGLKAIDGVGLTLPPYFNENLPLRDEPTRINTIAGAMEIQRVLDRIAWAAQICSTVAVAPRLRLAPPAGVPKRPFLFQWSRSDQLATNPSATQIIRAGDVADRVAFYRHDLNTEVPDNPHAFLSAVRARPNFARIAIAAQHQIGTFFESDGVQVVTPEPAALWEVPIRTPLPENLFFLPRPARIPHH